MSALKLGKHAPTKDDRDITMSSVIKAGGPKLPTPPASFGHASMYPGDSWQMLGNGPDDTVAPGFAGAGDCVPAGGGHETMMTNRLAGKKVTITGRESIHDYSAITGYIVGDDATDQGTNVRDALKYRAKVGLLDAAGNRHKIGAYVALNPGDWAELRQAIYVFSAVGIGVQFPQSAADQFNAGKPWSYVPSSPIEGGHYIPGMGCESHAVAGIVTWARRVSMQQKFYEELADEAWAIVYPEELRNGKTERGYDLSGLTAALAQLGH